MKFTAQDVYNKLMNDDQILTSSGQIVFKFGDIGIIVKQKDVVGNIMQEWVKEWLAQNRITYEISQNTQMPPDFYLDPSDKTVDLLEVKAFDNNRGPGFDIADFRMFAAEAIDKPYMLDADYLIFGYVMNNGVVRIKNLFLKKVWEITCSSADWPMKLQVKQNVVHKIRPSTWYSSKVTFKPFTCLEHFVSALEQTVYQNADTRHMAGKWQNRFLKSYQDHYGKPQLPSDIGSTLILGATSDKKTA